MHRHLGVDLLGGLPQAWSVVYDAAEVVVPLAMVPVVARTHRPYVALAWLLAIVIAPIAGSLTYLYLGEYRVRRGRRRHREMNQLLSDLDGRLVEGPAAKAERPEDRQLMDLAERLGGPRIGGWPARGGNVVDLFDESEALLDRLVADVERAEHHVHLLFYLYAADAAGRRLAEALVDAAQRGVTVRLLAGAYSSRFEASHSLYRKLRGQLREEGVEVVALRPLNPLRNGMARIDLRNHRKLALVDGRIAYVGSQNVHDPDMGLAEGRWHQLMARIRGPAALHLQGVFLQDWLRETGECLDVEAYLPRPEPVGDVAVQVLSWGPADDHPSFVRVLVGLLGWAQERVVLTSPYFVPDLAVLVALEVAAARGVRVDLIVPHRSDKWYVDAAARAHFETLLETGVRIHRHRTGVLHSKCASVDDSVALVGSGNCDRRSFYLDDEVAVLIYDADLACSVRRTQEAYMAASDRVDPETWKRRSQWRSTADRTCALLSPLL